MNHYVRLKPADLYRPNARFIPERQRYQVLTPFGKLGYSLKVLKTKGGYVVVPGGKGSHVKLKKRGEPQMILPDNRKALSVGALQQVKRALRLGSIDAIGKLL